MTKTARTWLIVVVLLAVAVAAWQLFGPIDLCPDGHCPDVGSAEWNGALARRNAERPFNALMAGGAVAAVGALAWFVWTRLIRKR